LNFACLFRASVQFVHLRSSCLGENQIALGIYQYDFYGFRMFGE
jgi:hypothetical protein